MRFENRVAVVTGGGKNIGRGIAARLASEGAHCVVAGRTEATLEACVADIEAEGGRASAIVCDVRDEESVRRLFSEIESGIGPIDVLVNNAGVEMQKPFVDVSTAEWDDLFAVNTRGVFLCTREALPRFAKSGGAIVNVASAAGLVALPLGAAYGATKAAVIQMSRALAIELRPRSIRVNAVCPGFIDTDMARKGIAAYEEIGLPVRSLIGYRQGRIGTVEEVADVVAFAASEEARFVNGQALAVDGGASVC